ncbi:MAG: hypothetical protein HC910_12165 [Spirulinaceae cyanobacterium SM2_1_0]|nr:hypothetical protein [Spirulinaceae cyanobacterium SM2_1_0]
MTMPALPKLAALPMTLPLEGAVRLELVEGVPVLRASAQVQARIEELLDRQREMALTASEVRELDAYGEIDDYLSLINRLVRNLMLDSRQSRADDLVG